MAHELSPFERKPDQYTGFPTGVKNMSEAAHPHRGGALQNLMEGGLASTHWWEAWGWGGFQVKENYFVNICTVACKLKNVIFVLN